MTNPALPEADPILSASSAAAAAACYLSRGRGLPNVHGLRVAIVTRHQDPCDWCHVPAETLLDDIRDFVNRPRDRRRA